MKILFLSWNFPPANGGIEYIAEHLFNGLKSRSVDIKLITKQNNKQANSKDIFRSTYRGIIGYQLFCMVKGLSLFKRWQFDIIVCGSIVSAAPARILSAIFGKPYIVLIHGSDILFGNKIYQFFLKYLLRSADALCANSVNTKRLLMESGCRNDKTAVIHPGVDCIKFEKIEEQNIKNVSDQYEGRQILLTVGRLIRRKGILQFIENAMPELAEKFPNILYLVVGEDATQSLAHKERLKDIIQKKIEDLNLKNNIKLLGKVSSDELIKLFFRSDIFVLPCIEVPGDVEGFGIVFLEAALAGTPSVASRLGGIPDAIADLETGILVDPSDYSGYVRAITRLIEEGSYKEELAKSGKRRVYEKFCWDLILRQYKGLFTFLLYKRNGSIHKI